MGDPKKQRKKYSTPSHPWQKERIDEERELSRAYGLKNKQEIWKMKSILRNFTHQAKKLTASRSKQSEKESLQLLQRLRSLGLLQESSNLSNVLELTIKDILERRVQSIVFRKELARTMNQARQFIVHGHINIGDKKITSPGCLVLKEEESKITFSNGSSLTDEMHPERVKLEAAPKKPKKTEKKKSFKSGNMPRRKQGARK